MITKILLLAVLLIPGSYAQTARRIWNYAVCPTVPSSTPPKDGTPLAYNAAKKCWDTAGGGNVAIGTTAIASSLNAQTGTTYTLTSADNGRVLTFNNASAITLTVPAGLPVGFSCLIVQLGAGAVTPTASSTTIRQRQSYTKTAGQYAIATLTGYVADTYILAGDLQ